MSEEKQIATPLRRSSRLHAKKTPIKLMPIPTPKRARAIGTPSKKTSARKGRRIGTRKTVKIDDAEDEEESEENITKTNLMQIEEENEVENNKVVNIEDEEKDENTVNEEEEEEEDSDVVDIDEDNSSNSNSNTPNDDDNEKEEENENNNNDNNEDEETDESISNNEEEDSDVVEGENNHDESEEKEEEEEIINNNNDEEEDDDDDEAPESVSNKSLQDKALQMQINTKNTKKRNRRKNNKKIEIDESENANQLPASLLQQITQIEDKASDTAIKIQENKTNIQNKHIDFTKQKDGFNLVLLQGHVKENRLKGSGTDKNILEFLNKQFNKKNREKAGTALSKRSNHSLAFRMVSVK